MAKKYLDNDGLLYLWQKITNAFVKKDGSKVLSDNNYTSDEKTKLSGIETGATKTIVDSALSSTSANPVENKAIYTALGKKVDKVTGKGLSTNDFTTAEKNKLADIAEGATRVIVDDVLSASSANPVQNKVINTALSNKVDKVSGKGLSTNDLTNELKATYDATVETVAELTETGGEPNKVDDVKVNGTTVVTNKVANISVPTKVSQLTNDSGYITGIPTEYITEDELTEAISSKAEISSIPTKTSQLTNDSGFLTSVPSTYVTETELNNAIKNKADDSDIPTKTSQLTNDSGFATTSYVDGKVSSVYRYRGSAADKATLEAIPTANLTVGDVYNVQDSGMNYAWTGSEWDNLGSDIDLSGYLEEADLIAITNSEIDTIVAN